MTQYIIIIRTTMNDAIIIRLPNKLIKLNGMLNIQFGSDIAPNMLIHLVWQKYKLLSHMAIVFSSSSDLCVNRRNTVLYY